MPLPGTLGGAPEPSAVSTSAGLGLDGLGSDRLESDRLGSDRSESDRLEFEDLQPGLPGGWPACAIAVKSSAFEWLPPMAATGTPTVAAPEVVTCCRVWIARP